MRYVTSKNALNIFTLYVPTEKECLGDDKRTNYGWIIEGLMWKTGSLKRFMVANLGKWNVMNKEYWRSL